MFDRALNLSEFNDEYLEGLKKIIDAKIGGQAIVAPTREEPGNGRNAACPQRGVRGRAPAIVTVARCARRGYSWR